MKLIGSIIAISGIDLLKAFVAVGELNNEQLAWKVGIHLTFVVSGLMFAIMDWLGAPRSTEPVADMEIKTVRARFLIHG